ncbi:hypothetical protein KFE25_001153 [Diacronema lutheri]|uniref:Uncharacterized protein n=3 Tax=Diacronema lutheri TaxID=2081491 RepID=A0A8J5XC70_DIALT|nr:hypothetical protein KFE25_001153 [Diacronema lutheri]
MPAATKVPARPRLLRTWRTGVPIIRAVLAVRFLQKVATKKSDGGWNREDGLRAVLKETEQDDFWEPYGAVPTPETTNKWLKDWIAEKRARLTIVCHAPAACPRSPVVAVVQNGRTGCGDDEEVQSAKRASAETEPNEEYFWEVLMQNVIDIENEIEERKAKKAKRVASVEAEFKSVEKATFEKAAFETRGSKRLKTSQVINAEGREDGGDDTAGRGSSSRSGAKGAEKPLILDFSGDGDGSGLGGGLTGQPMCVFNGANQAKVAQAEAEKATADKRNAEQLAKKMAKAQMLAVQNATKAAESTAALMATLIADSRAQADRQAAREASAAKQQQEFMLEALKIMRAEKATASETTAGQPANDKIVEAQMLAVQNATKAAESTTALMATLIADSRAQADRQAAREASAAKQQQEFMLEALKIMRGAKD